jgi:hypothetical protein
MIADRIHIEASVSEVCREKPDFEARLRAVDANLNQKGN